MLIAQVLGLPALMGSARSTTSSPEAPRRGNLHGVKASGHTANSTFQEQGMRHAGVSIAESAYCSMLIRG